MNFQSWSRSMILLQMYLLLKGPIRCLAASTGAEFAGSSAGLDLNMMGNLANNLASNPQLMGMLTGLVSPRGPIESGDSLDTDPTQLIESGQPPVQSLGQTIEPIRRASKPSVSSSVQDTSSKRPDAQVANLEAATVTANTATGSTTNNPLAGLMSLLPKVLPNLANIGDLLNITSKLQPVIGGNQPSSSQQVNNNQAGGVKMIASAESTTNQASAQNPLQSTLNQILAAYSAGQIPNELIQMAMSGKIPAQVIEMALTGQIPPQLIQMVITGQVPASSINTLLSSVPITSVRPGTQSQGLRLPSLSGLGAVTRGFYEAVFGKNGLAMRQNNSTAGKEPSQSHSFSVPTLLGLIPIQIPTARRIGKAVGGTISNVASMIPF